MMHPPVQGRRNDDLDEAYELIEVQDLLDEFDELYEKGLDGSLTSDDAAQMDELFKRLQAREDEFWRGVPEQAMVIIGDEVETHFLAMRYLTGTMPERDN